jgi:hypothetical protein
MTHGRYLGRKLTTARVLEKLLGPMRHERKSVPKSIHRSCSDGAASYLPGILWAAWGSNPEPTD